MSFPNVNLIEIKSMDLPKNPDIWDVSYIKRSQGELCTKPVRLEKWR